MESLYFLYRALLHKTSKNTPKRVLDKYIEEKNVIINNYQKLILNNWFKNFNFIKLLRLSYTSIYIT